MAQGQYSSDERVEELLQEIFDLWSSLSKNEEGEELRSPANKKETIKSRNILDELLQMNLSNKDQIRRYEELDRVITDYEETQSWADSPNGQAEKLQTQIYNLWTTVSHKDGDEYHSPASMEEVEKSWPLIEEIEKLKIDEKYIIDRLKLHREILEEFTESEIRTKGYDKAWNKLTEIYQSWGDVNYKGGKEYRNPDNRSEIRTSRALLKEIKSMDVDFEDVLERYKELEEVVDDYDSVFPNNRRKMIRSIVFSLLIISGLVLIFNINTFNSPEFEYNKEWFVTVKAGEMLFKVPPVNSEIKRKIKLRKRTQLKPIARIGTDWFQVETSDGQRGFVKNTLLSGMRFAVAKENAKVFDKVASGTGEPFGEGEKVKVLERKKWRIYSNDIMFIKIKIQDGRLKWAREDGFNYPFLGVPDINNSFEYRVNEKEANKQILGKSINQIEKRYGPATSVLKVRDTIRAYFKYLVVVNGNRNYKGVSIIIDDSAVGQFIELNDYGKRRVYNYFPLVNILRKFEPNKIFNYTFYNDNIIQFQWWEDFKEINWIT